MKILAIETSCDETAVAVLEATESGGETQFRILGNALLSQVDIHKEYGGVFPALAKREHAKNLVPLLQASLAEAELLVEDTQAISPKKREELAELLAREPGLADAFFAFVSETETPDIDAIAVTSGPGLEPALWVGINFAKALSLLWEKPLIAVNHMEGHVFAALTETDGSNTLTLSRSEFPVLALLISGGHTELVLMKENLSYELIGQTRDDAVGEAYDKVARMLDLPYPGGPEVSKLAEATRIAGGEKPFTLPRPMLDSGNADFSFSGLKTAVLYLIKERGELSNTDKGALAREFEDAVADVLWKKTSGALEDTQAYTLVIGGGVSANTNIRRILTERMSTEHPDVTLRIPHASLTTDNALMIGIAGYFRAKAGTHADPVTLAADGNLSLAG